MAPEQALAELRERLAELSDLGAAAAVLDWDAQVNMPAAGAERRADAQATVGRLAHERFVEDRVGELLEAAGELDGDPDSDDAALLRVTRRDYEKARRVPSDLLAELTRAAALGQHAWERARAESDFAAFRPYLERNVELRRRYAECFPDVEHPYDAQLDDFEPGMRTAEVKAVFGPLRDGLKPLVAAIAERPVPDERLWFAEEGAFPIDAQRRVCARIVEALGFEADAWRLDVSAHPFSTSFGQRDIRLTTRFTTANLDSITSTIHEAGHGLYEHGIDRALERTPLSDGVSMAVHESQSRLWENMVGRGLPFWRWAFPLLRDAFPKRFAGAGPEDVFRALNVVKPSLIRVEADEVTYCLHVILRFELEVELFEGRLDVADLPEAWNARVRDFLGVEVPDDRRGVLQDVHWAAGLFGYFPTYALGTVISAQLWERVRAELPDLDARLERGEFGALLAWLREHVHRHGRKHTPRETVRRAVGGPIDPQPFLQYLRAKHGALYAL